MSRGYGRRHASPTSPDHRPRRAPVTTGAGSQERAGVAAGAAIKADGYGLGARETMRRAARGRLPRLLRVDLGRGEELGTLPGRRQPGRSARRWARRCRGGAATSRRGRCSTASSRSRGGRRSRRAAPCDVMIDTGMNRLGLRPDEIGVARRPDDRHAAQPSRLRRRGPSR